MAAVAWLLAGCDSERIVLLPSKDGRASGVVVRNAGGQEVLLDTPYAGVASGLFGRSNFQTTAAEIDASFGPALAAMPPAPKSFTLYFEAGSDMLTPASEDEFAQVRREIARRPAAEAMVIGHTDRVGSPEANEQLSMRRAELIRDQLLRSGIAASQLEAVGRGEREPLVATDDDVPEPRNRRVEINVR